MREININIEGYNVNGICVGCLNYNRKMYYASVVTECFKILANIDVPDGLSIQVCWECLAAVNTALKFRKRILSSYQVLNKYSKEHIFLGSPEDLTKHASTRLSRSDIQIHASSEVDDAVLEPKTDLEDVLKHEELVENKFDFDIDSVKDEPDLPQDDLSESLPSQEHDVSSEDDVQLSKLKKKREKRERKSKKRKKREKSARDVKDEDVSRSDQKPNRKLKNLPEGLVELFTMTEEEMWKIRSEDIGSEEFKKMRYKCSDCVLGFHNKKLMNDHLNGKHKPKGEASHPCDVCKAFFLTKDNLSVHRSLHLSAYRCKECSFETTLKRFMVKHVASHQQGSEEFHCSTCGSSFNTKSKLTYHVGVCHNEKPQCDCCGKVFANKVTLKYHLKVLPRNKEEKPKEKLNIPCKECNKIFHSKKSYRAHVVIHEGLTYPCPTCGKLFMWKRNLARHARNHREREAGALHHCAECGKTFASRDCYHNHLRLSKKHASQDSYVHECNYCGKKFATKWCMVDHMDWEHLKRIKYQCSVCFKAFKTAKIMVAHMNNLHGSKKLEVDGEHLCDICGKSYKTVKRLKGHVWAMHTKRSNTKSFRCSLCPATFTWQTSIYKHMKVMHNRNKQSRTQPLLPVKKEDPYPGLELANRMQYFQQNIAQAQLQPLGVMQNIV